MSNELTGDIAANAPTDENQSIAKNAARADGFTDLWLRHHLTQLYGQVPNEPLPEELVALLQSRLG